MALANDLTDDAGPARRGLLEICAISKTFQSGAGSVEALSDFSLSIQEGEFVTLLGPSGCGKSTLLHIIGGFDFATAGAAFVNDVEVERQVLTGA